MEYMTPSRVGKEIRVSEIQIAASQIAAVRSVQAQITQPADTICLSCGGVGGDTRDTDTDWSTCNVCGGTGRNKAKTVKE